MEKEGLLRFSVAKNGDGGFFNLLYLKIEKGRGIYDRRSPKIVEPRIFEEFQFSKKTFICKKSLFPSSIFDLRCQRS